MSWYNSLAEKEDLLQNGVWVTWTVRDAEVISKKKEEGETVMISV